jgi:hypothetical protein
LRRRVQGAREVREVLERVDEFFRPTTTPSDEASSVAAF